MSLVVEVWEEERQKVSRTFEFRKMGPLCEVGHLKLWSNQDAFIVTWRLIPFCKSWWGTNGSLRAQDFEMHRDQEHQNYYLLTSFSAKLETKPHLKSHNFKYIPIFVTREKTLRCSSRSIPQLWRLTSKERW